jgi:hypothetical protein
MTEIRLADDVREALQRLQHFHNSAKLALAGKRRFSDADVKELMSAVSIVTSASAELQSVENLKGTSLDLVRQVECELAALRATSERLAIMLQARKKTIEQIQSKRKPLTLWMNSFQQTE